MYSERILCLNVIYILQIYLLSVRRHISKSNSHVVPLSKRLHLHIENKELMKYKKVKKTLGGWSEFDDFEKSFALINWSNTDCENRSLYCRVKSYVHNFSTHFTLVITYRGSHDNNSLMKTKEVQLLFCNVFNFVSLLI